MSESRTSEPTAAAAEPVTAAPVRRPGINWVRFWLQMLAAMLVFNIVAGVITWFFIFPHLHPAH